MSIDLYNTPISTPNVNLYVRDRERIVLCIIGVRIILKIAQYIDNDSIIAVCFENRKSVVHLSDLLVFSRFNKKYLFSNPT